MFQHLQKEERKHTEESTRQTPDDKDQQGGEKRETYKTDKVEVKKDQSKGKKCKASDASNREEKQDIKEERQQQTFDTEVKKEQSNAKKRKASDASNREKMQDRKEERQPQTFDMDSDIGHEGEVEEASDSAGCSLNNPTEGIKGIKVFGRLALTGQRKTQYIVTEEEIQRRIEGENMSSNVFRDLLGVSL